MNSISVDKNNHLGQIRLTSDSNWFDSEHVIVIVHVDSVIITKPTLDYDGKMYKVQKSGSNSVVRVKLDIPLGKFEIDADESTEDKLVIYYPLPI